MSPTPRLTDPISSGRAGGRLLGSGDAAVKMFFPGEEDDVEMNPPISHPDSYAVARNRWVTVSGAPPELDVPPVSSQKVESQIPTPVPQESLAHQEVDEETGEPASRNPQPCQSPQPSRSGNADPAVTIVHTLEESVSHPVRIKEELYKIVSQVGEGTFGKVYKAQNTVSRTFVALKRIRMEGERDGFPVTAMREIKLLQSLRHPNVVNLHEMMVSKGECFSIPECLY